VTEEAVALSPCHLVTLSSSGWQEPRAVPLLRDLLESAAENRRLREQPLHDHLEQEIDALHRALEEQVHGEAQRLQSGKLAALAAGPGNATTTPPAFCPGKANYLPGQESAWSREAAQAPPPRPRGAMGAQTRRTHAIPRALMQSAKPPPPCPGWVDLPAML